MNALSSDAYSNNVQNLDSCNYINSRNIGQILRGSSILSGGGGGSYRESLENYRSSSSDEVEVRDLDDFSENDTIVTVFGLGPVDHETEDPLSVAQQSVEMYESEYGEIEGIILGELGPDLIVEAVAIADRLDVPIADADVAGMRAVPSIQNEIIEGAEVSRTPLVATDGEDSAYIEEGTGQEIERAVRELTDSDIWYITGYANPAAGYSGSVPQGWFDECIDPDGSQREVLGSGTLESVESEEVDGHTVGRMLIRGEETIELYFQNENLLAYIDGEEAARAPDTISAVDSNGVGINNGDLPEEGEQLEVHRISHDFWQDASCFNLETQRISADEDTVNFQENTEFDITGDNQ
ncbi:MAG: DUF917 family protein [Candidatus Nanohalobium sp.]